VEKLKVCEASPTEYKMKNENCKLQTSGEIGNARAVVKNSQKLYLFFTGEGAMVGFGWTGLD
jgi:hypothetical protein